MSVSSSGPEAPRIAASLRTLSGRGHTHASTMSPPTDASDNRSRVLGEMWFKYDAAEPIVEPTQIFTWLGRSWKRIL